MKEIISAVMSNGRITIPREIRRHLGVTTPGKIVFVIDDDDKVELRPLRYSVADLRGILPALPGKETDDFNDLIDEAMTAGIPRMMGEEDEL